MTARGVFSLVVAGSVAALTAVGACGGGSSKNPAAPGDASATSTDGGSTAQDGALSIPGPGMATLNGPQAFPVGSAQLGPSLTGGCGGSIVPDSGVIPTVSILLTSEGLPPLLCSDGTIPDGGTGYWLDLEIATIQAAMGDEVLTQSIMPGTYVIGDEAEDDPDLCMLAPGSNAFLQIATPTSGDALYTAIQGSVTIDSVSEHAITGTFTVLLGGPYGTSDASPPPTLSGAFNATSCH
ncbi:MAG TPA: hypothetical protein VGL81_02265 [Polyangiaceae bacterium]|jgi:hypothetical protein